MTWGDVHDLVKGWRKHPPMQRMFQDYLKSKGLEYEQTEDSFEKPLPTGTGAWFDGIDTDQFTSQLGEQAALMAKKLKLN